ncbi:TetR-like C-terminal domain-containing protein [Leuconostoc pseudomesenteroides]|uniref:TetR/AcrR family transcriptional regulator n=1 Tax=Leuconostoc pseudomesenteroides TaxID=33968 RepID=UPI00301C6145
MVNQKNNHAKKGSIIAIEKAFVRLLQYQEIKEISVTKICQEAHVNRSTFYANFIDVFDLVDKLQERMMSEFTELYEYEVNEKYNSNDFLKLFRHISANRILYKTYFKLNLNLKVNIVEDDSDLAKKLFNSEYLDYHSEFFRSGITAIIRKWLNNDCDLSPATMSHIIASEYQSKITHL